MDVIQKIVTKLGGSKEVCNAIAAFGNSHPDEDVLSELKHRLEAAAPPDGYPSWEDWLFKEHQMRIVPALSNPPAWAVKQMRDFDWKLVEFDINGWHTTEFPDYPAALAAAKKEAGR